MPLTKPGDRTKECPFDLESCHAPHVQLHVSVSTCMIRIPVSQELHSGKGRQERQQSSKWALVSIVFMSDAQMRPTLSQLRPVLSQTCFQFPILTCCKELFIGSSRFSHQTKIREVALRCSPSKAACRDIGLSQSRAQEMSRVASVYTIFTRTILHILPTCRMTWSCRQGIILNMHLLCASSMITFHL